MRRLLLVLSLVLLATSARASWNTLNDVLDPAPWCTEGGAGDIYSPFMMKQGNKYLLYFGGFYERCRVKDAIYVADYDPLLGVATNVRTVIAPENVGFVAMNDPTIVELSNGTRKYWVMYMTGVQVDTGHVTDNKVYVSFSWADDGINWSVPTLTIDGVWNPGAAIRPTDGHVVVWAHDTTTGVLRLHDLGVSGVTLSSISDVVAPFAYTNAEARWNTHSVGFDILAATLKPTFIEIDRLFSRDGITWNLVTAEMVPQTAGWWTITPAWDLSNLSALLYGKYANTWPPVKNSIWRARQ